MYLYYIKYYSNYSCISTLGRTVASYVFPGGGDQGDQFPPHRMFKISKSFRSPNLRPISLKIRLLWIQSYSPPTQKPKYATEADIHRKPIYITTACNWWYNSIVYYLIIFTLWTNVYILQLHISVHATRIIIVSTIAQILYTYIMSCSFVITWLSAERKPLIIYLFKWVSFSELHIWIAPSHRPLLSILHLFFRW